MKINLKENMDNLIIGSVIMFLINEGGEDMTTIFTLSLLLLA